MGHTPAETIIAQLGAVGILISGIADPKLPRWDAIQKYLLMHPGVDFRILDDSRAEFPDDCPKLILCEPTAGINDETIAETIKNWFLKFNCVK
jgi:hypothetical protein